MRFKLEKGVPIPVTFITLEGSVISNPPDELIDEHSAGYPLLDVPMPSYNETLQKVPTYVWELVSGSITKVWTVESYTEDELKARRNAARLAQIEKNNFDFESKKSEPLIYTNGKGYLPRWTIEYYLPLASLGEAAFPQNVMAADGTISNFSYQEFQALIAFLVVEFGKITAEVNAENARIQGEMEE